MNVKVEDYEERLKENMRMKRDINDDIIQLKNEIFE